MARDLNLLHPEVKKKAQALIEICRKRGIEIIITETFRSKKEQDDLYAQGRTKPGNIVTNAKYPQSLHCWGVAFDFAVMIGGKVNWSHIASYDAVGSLGKSLGLAWGGDWKTFVDRPHFELPGYNWSQLQQKHDTPEKFIASWPKEEKPVGKFEKEAQEAKAWVDKQGISDGSRPDDPVTRKEVWVMLYRFAKLFVNILGGKEND